MKSLPFLLLAIVATSALAESPYERELMQLAAQRDQQVAAVTEPIDRKYKEALEGLLRRATQANDLDAALKIRQAQGITGAAAVAAPATVTLTKLGLERRIEGKTFGTDSKSWLRKMTFEKGKVIHNPNEKGQGRSATFHAIDGVTIALQWDGKPETVTFSPDLSTCTRGNVKYTKQ